MKPSDEQIKDLVTRGIESVYPSTDALIDKIQSGDVTTWYLGIDPTGPSLHVGHAIVLKKLQVLQKLGHKIILLIGDFTATIGDPTDKSATRIMLTREQVLKNATSYKDQATKFLDFSGENPAELRYNSEWLGAMKFEDVVQLSSHFTVQRMLERDMFEKRIREGKPVYLHEFLYPLMQAYDSVIMDVDGEVGGNDQTFNMLAGRTLMRDLKQKDKFVITMKLLADTTGKKMGKSEGNMITLTDTATDMFGKIMSWTDGMIMPGFELLTDLSFGELQKISKELENGANPRDVKDYLAQEVVAFYYNKETAEEVSCDFKKLFTDKGIPSVIEEYYTSSSIIVDILVDSGLASSKTDARRLISGGGVKINNEVVNDPEFVLQSSEEGVILQKGKRHFLKILSK